MWKQSYFWFSQPSSYLINYDMYFMWFFVALFGFGLVFKIATLVWKNEVYKKLFKKFSNVGFTLGLVGLAWFGLRYENTPIFSNRFWAGLIVAILIIWKFFILKYLILKFPAERRYFQKALVNSKYIPGKK